MVLPAIGLLPDGLGRDIGERMLYGMMDMNSDVTDIDCSLQAHDAVGTSNTSTVEGDWRLIQNGIFKSD